MKINGKKLREIILDRYDSINIFLRTFEKETGNYISITSFYLSTSEKKNAMCNKNRQLSPVDTLIIFCDIIRLCINYLFRIFSYIIIKIYSKNHFYYLQQKLFKTFLLKLKYQLPYLFSLYYSFLLYEGKIYL